MNSTDPTDLSPLSFGAGLALGLMLILGLPRATVPGQTAGRRESAFELRMPEGRDHRVAAGRDSLRESSDPIATAPR